MASVVHFKFRNALLQDMVSFDGDHVSLQALKRLIAKKKGLSKALDTDIDFAVSNLETQEGVAWPAQLLLCLLPTLSPFPVSRELLAAPASKSNGVCAASTGL